MAQKRAKTKLDRADADGGGPAGHRGDGFAIGAVVRWRHVATLVRALGATVAPAPQSWPALERLVVGLTDPLRRLDALAADVERAMDGDEHAVDDVRAGIRQLAAVINRAEVAEALCERPAGHGAQHGCGCGCDGAKDKHEVVYRDGRDPSHEIVLSTRSAATGHSGDHHGDEPGEHPTDQPSDQPADDANILDETALTALLLGAVFVVGPQGRDDAVDVVTALALAAGGLGTLHLVHARGGEVALAAHVEFLAGGGLLAWVAATTVVPVPVPMQTLSGGGPAMPGNVPVPGLPGVPGGGVPGETVPGIPGHPDVDDFLKHRFGDLIAELLKHLKKRPHWDPDLYDHAYPWWTQPIRYVDPRWTELVRCFLEAQRYLKARSEPEPPRPARAVWSDGITDVSLSGACAGGTITITGQGFGSSQPADVVLLLPTLQGCRPVTPLTWEPTKITAVMPADVASGPVGFVDASYLAEYDAWADRRNAADAVLSRLQCARYVPLYTPRFSECPPPTAINQIRAGAPVITAFTANNQMLLGLEPGVPLTLRWTVKNAETVTVERISSSGPLFAGSSSLMNPAASSWVLGTPSYSALQVWTYRLTVTGACGGPVSRTVTVVAGKRPALRIDTIEVTQSIQTVPATVRLVESKPTVVRVTVRHGLAGWGGDTVPNVRGRIRVRGADIGTSPWFDAANGTVDQPMTPSPGAAITVKAVPARNATDDTLNFIIPPGWARGSNTRVDVEVRVALYGATSGFPGYTEQVTRSTAAMVFERRRALQFRYIRLAWAGGAAPTDQVCRDTLAGSVPLLPTPTAGVAPVPGVGVQTVNLASGSNGDTERRNLLDDWEDRHNCSTFESLFEWLGFDCPEDDGAIWVLIPGQFARGEAYDIPSNVCMTPPSNGPYAAHELSHCLNQTHVSVSCSNGQQATGGDAPSAWPNMAQLQDVPFDVVRNRALTLAGTGVFDVMTYCGTPNNTWPMPVRWQRLWDRIGA